jgi:superfamily II DNA/RNA helicase
MDALTSFDTLELPNPVKKALAHSNISTPTEIQAQAIPHALAGKDVIGLAQTGTGKTLAFCLPLVTLMDKAGDNDECALILAPTREIAIQVTEVIKHLTLKMTGRWHPVLVIGGVGMQPQIDGLKKNPRFIVATPGRLVDHMREKHAKLDNVKFLVLDEADRMLDMGFAPQLNEVLRGVPKERQTMLFSATFPNEIAEMSQKYLVEPVRIEVGPGHSVPIDTIKQETREMAEEDKFKNLVELLNVETGTVIVFTRTKFRTEKLARQLEKNGISAGRIHGDRSQSQRQTTLKAFKDGEIRVLVATDIAARGIDVPEVALVINYDLPNVPEEFIHRIGRTGRAGAEGKAIAFLTAECREEWRAILKLIDPELYAKTPHVPNAVRPEKPQHGHQQRGPRHDNRQGGGRGDRGGRHERNDRGPRHDRGGQRFERGPRHDNRHQQRPPEIIAEGHGNQFHEEDVGHQPSLEEQLSRIDRGQKRERFPRGNNNNRGGMKGGRGGQQRHQRGGGGQRPHRGASGGGNFTAAPAGTSNYHHDDDEGDNIGNR